MFCHTSEKLSFCVLDVAFGISVASSVSHHCYPHFRMEIHQFFIGVKNFSMRQFDPWQLKSSLHRTETRNTVWFPWNRHSTDTKVNHTSLRSGWRHYDVRKQGRTLFVWMNEWTCRAGDDVISRYIFVQMGLQITKSRHSPLHKSLQSTILSLSVCIRCLFMIIQRRCE